jgi:hypothetical protein
MPDEGASWGNPFAMWWPWNAAGPPAAQFSQPILPGWTVGGVVINQTNSRSPDTERAIVAEESYGRQIGKLLDAVALLIGDRQEGPEPQAFRDVLALRKHVERIKTISAARRLGEVESDLARLKACDQQAYAAAVSRLRHLLGELS